jgi:hypothetical protein
MMTAMIGVFQWPDFLSAFGRAAEAAGFQEMKLAETDAGPLLVWERPVEGPRVYLSAGIHGDEPAGPLALLKLMEEKAFGAEIHWSICPALNPTGLESGTRENAAGVDLNRDYWVRSTPEVQAHAAWLASRGIPELFISLHEDWEANGFYFYEINLGEDHPERARGIIEAVRPWFPPDAGEWIDGHLPRGEGWIFHAAEADVPEGWPEAIYIAKQGCPLSFTFETPSDEPLGLRVAAQCAAVRAALRHLTDQCGER